MSKNILYRIVFVSPFFELEVANGYQQWQRARSQEKDPDATEYPLLQFKSHTDAENYATKHLGLEIRKPSWFARLFSVFVSGPISQRHDDVMQVPPGAIPLPKPAAVVFSIN